MKDRKLLNIELSRIEPSEYSRLPDSGIIVVLDNIRSAHNIGSVFRTCDAFKVDKIYLCGICQTPPSAEMHKSALGAEDSVPWEYSDSTLDTVAELHRQGYAAISIEQTINSMPLNEFVPNFNDGNKYALIFGNEVEGVSQDVVDASDLTLEIPQFGAKHSLNISVSAGVILWHFTLNRI